MVHVYAHRIAPLSGSRRPVRGICTRSRDEARLYGQKQLTALAFSPDGTTTHRVGGWIEERTERRTRNTSWQIREPTQAAQ